MSTSISRPAQEAFAVLIDQWLQANADQLGIHGGTRSDGCDQIALIRSASKCGATANDAAIYAANCADRAQGLDRREFELANERLCAALRRMAPNVDWLCERPLYPRFEDVARLRLAGYSCRVSGYVVKRNIVGFRKRWFTAFDTYSWSWDGTIDEEWLGDKIFGGQHRSYRLSDHRTPETRMLIGMPWVRE